MSFLTTIKHINRETAWQKQYNLNAPKVGEPAPDFELLSVDQHCSFRLSDYIGKKPVALIFGSFS